MPLPSSGTISLDMIRNELSTRSGDLRFLSSLAGFGTPDFFSDFYGYSACPPYGQFAYSYCSGCDLIYGYHNGSCGYYEQYIGFSNQCCGGFYCNCCCGCFVSSQPCSQIGCFECFVAQ
jgi:hypothetical protein